MTKQEIIDQISKEYSKDVIMGMIQDKTETFWVEDGDDTFLLPRYLAEEYTVEELIRPYKKMLSGDDGLDIYKKLCTLWDIEYC